MNYLDQSDQVLMSRILDPNYGLPQAEPEAPAPGAPAMKQGEADYFSWYAEELTPELKRRLEKEARERLLRAYLARQDAPDAWFEFKLEAVAIPGTEVVGALMKDLMRDVLRKAGEESARRRASKEVEEAQARAAAGISGAAGQVADLRARLQGGLLDALPPSERAEAEEKMARMEQLLAARAQGEAATAASARGTPGAADLEAMRRRSVEMEAQVAELNELVRGMQEQLKEAGERGEVEERLRRLERDREERAREERAWLFGLAWEAFVAEVARREGRSEGSEEARRREEEGRRREEEARAEEERRRREAEEAAKKQKKKSSFCSVM
eukprot:tig00021348_g20576.t1